MTASGKENINSTNCQGLFHYRPSDHVGWRQVLRRSSIDFASPKTDVASTMRFVIRTAAMLGDPEWQLSGVRMVNNRLTPAI
jgi:hypothetical protein